jgi:hypothetical protein
MVIVQEVQDLMYTRSEGFGEQDNSSLVQFTNSVFGLAPNMDPMDCEAPFTLTFSGTSTEESLLAMTLEGTDAIFKRKRLKSYQDELS